MRVGGRPCNEVWQGLMRREGGKSAVEAHDYVERCLCSLSYILYRSAHWRPRRRQTQRLTLSLPVGVRGHTWHLRYQKSQVLSRHRCFQTRIYPSILGYWIWNIVQYGVAWFRPNSVKVGKPLNIAVFNSSSISRDAEQAKWATVFTHSGDKALMEIESFILQAQERC